MNRRQRRHLKNYAKWRVSFEVCTGVDLGTIDPEYLTQGDLMSVNGADEREIIRAVYYYHEIGFPGHDVCFQFVLPLKCDCALFIGNDDPSNCLLPAHQVIETLDDHNHKHEGH